MPELVEPVIRICAVISRHDSARQWAAQQLTEVWGKPLHISEELPFDGGGFYQPSMGTNLVKPLIGFHALADPAGLADWKQQTNQFEKDYALAHPHDESRPLNMDPGYLSQAKLVLATMKDRDHRLYLRDGVFAEVTLNYMGKKWVHHRWTYPSYRTESVAEFVTQCRQHLRAQLLSTGTLRQRTRSSGAS